MNDSALVFYGDSVKALGSGRIGGIVVPFAGPQAPDQQNEYFDEGTDFGFDVSTKARVVYHHGFTKQLGAKKLGVAELRLVPGEGVHGETQLDMNTPAGVELYAKATKGELFWSSGSTDRLVVRESVKGAVRLSSWPICEVSLTPNPVDKRARAHAIKAMVDDEASESAEHESSEDCCPTCGQPKKAKPTKSLPEDITVGSVAEPTLLDRSARLVADATELACLYAKAADQRQSEGRYLSHDKRAACKSLSDSLAKLAETPQAKADPERIKRLRLLELAGRV
jgi:phage head maturation protease